MKKVKYSLDKKVYEIEKYRIIKIGAFKFILHKWYSKTKRVRFSIHEYSTGQELATGRTVKGAFLNAKYWINELSDFYVSFFTTEPKLNSID